MAAKEAKKATVVQWNCEMCTIINQPGRASCHVCFSPAPASAFFDEEAEKMKQLAEAKRQKEEDERVA